MTQTVTIIKRNGSHAEFTPDKIYQALCKAAKQTFTWTDELDQQLIEITASVVRDIIDTGAEYPTISMIQAFVERRLLDKGLVKIAQEYIRYRLQRDIERSGFEDSIVVHLNFEEIPPSEG